MAIPKIKLTSDQRKWLEKVYECFINEKPYVKRYIKVELIDKIATNFNPESIDDRLIYQNQITLLGILHADPKSNLPACCDSYIRAIKSIIKEDPTIDEIPVINIKKRAKLENDDINRVVGILNQMGSFSRGYTLTEDPTKSYIRIGVDNIFDEYLQYNGIDTLLTTFSNRIVEERSFTGHLVKNLGVVEIANQSRQVIQQKGINPIFKSVVESIDKNLCFVLMPFKKSWSDSVFKKIRGIVEGMGLQCLRSDNLTGSIIMEDIWVKINQCAFVIVDVTSTNPNVMYELGIVHTVGKPAILITQDLSKIPFDFQHLRHFEYRNEIEGTSNIEEKLPEVIKKIYKESYSIDLLST